MLINVVEGRTRGDGQAVHTNVGATHRQAPVAMATSQASLIGAGGWRTTTTKREMMVDKDEQPEWGGPQHQATKVGVR